MFFTKRNKNSEKIVPDLRLQTSKQNYVHWSPSISNLYGSDLLRAALFPCFLASNVLGINFFLISSTCFGRSGPIPKPDSSSRHERRENTTSRPGYLRKRAMIALGSLSFSYSVDSLEFDPASIFDSNFRFKQIIQGFLSVLALAFLADL